MNMRKLLTGMAFSFGAITGLIVHGGAPCAAQEQVPPSSTATVDGVDYPVCSEEDCSDQPGQVGIWTDPDTGTQWLSLGEQSYRIER